ncbi:MAG: DNA ligase [Pseudomonadota bacterium]|nr:DNA ligase [Pseudomonadota bacterium]
MARALQAPTTAKEIAVRARQPGVPLVMPIEAGDLMLSTLRRAPFSLEGWIFEWKYDGFRCLIRKQGESVELISRPGNSLNRSFPEIVAAVAQVPGDFTWDAELTVDDPGGYSNFEKLRSRAVTSVASRVKAGSIAQPARLYMFDMLTIGNRDLRGLPLIKRKAFLRDSFDDTGTLVCTNGIVGAGEWVFEQVELHGFEGMVAKRLDSLYQRGRTHEWQKIKYAGYGRPAALGIRQSQF